MLYGPSVEIKKDILSKEERGKKREGRREREEERGKERQTTHWRKKKGAGVFYFKEFGRGFVILKYILKV